MDVLAVRGAAQRRVEWVRAGNGPVLLEMKTYRYRGHSMSDPAKYRYQGGIAEDRSERDPIEQVRGRLLANKWATEEDLKAIDKECATWWPMPPIGAGRPGAGCAELWTDILV